MNRISILILTTLLNGGENQIMLLFVSFIGMEWVMVQVRTFKFSNLSTHSFGPDDRLESWNWQLYDTFVMDDFNAFFDIK